jgi:hypothetical protein
MTTLRGIPVLLVATLFGAGCASGPKAPFDQMKTANVQAFRLQNYEPPPPPPGQAAPAPMAGIPGLPPEITQWAQQALPGLQQLLPPGLLPPGMMGGAPQAAPQAAPDAPRFPMHQPNFRILGQTQIMDTKLKEQLAEILGDEDSFQPEHANCMYAEMGLSFQTGAGLNDMLISFSCNAIEARGFAWPHPYRGLRPATVQKLATTVQKIWPGG